jgi:5-methylcytosine-specific restriction endonuclease McrA
MAGKAIDETGKTYGLLRVIQRQGRGKHGDALWLCRCQCGGECVTRGNRLRAGATRSCGCLRGSPTGETAFRRVMATTKYGARIRGLEWELTREQVLALHQQSCHYCGADPSNKMVTPAGDIYTYQGIDRIDNDGGYTLDNVVPCCKQCNRAKRDLGYNEFLAWATRIYTHLELGEI